MKKSVFLLLMLSACAPTQEEQTATNLVKEYLQNEVGGMCSALQTMLNAMPAQAWDAATPVATIKGEWKKARTSYARIEGSLTTLLPKYGPRLDGTYDAALASGTEFIGLHAVERVIFADEQSAAVVAFEQTLAGYEAAQHPATEGQAVAARELAAGVLADCEAMQADLIGKTLDAKAAYPGAFDFLLQQHHKVLIGGTGQDISRYAGYTLADMRANFEGQREVYGAFSLWVRSKQDGVQIDIDVMRGLDDLEELYESTGGEALPPVPAGFNPDAPSPSQLDSDPYGRLFAKLGRDASKEASSLTTKLNAAAKALELPQR